CCSRACAAAFPHADWLTSSSPDSRVHSPVECLVPYWAWPSDTCGRRATGDVEWSAGFAMPDLIIRIKKKTDGAAALSCTRADGSVTWQRQDGQLGRFFPLHDLTHFAVE